MIHTILTMIWTIIATIVFGIMAIAFSLLTGSGKLSHRIAGIWASSILHVAGVKVKVKGFGNISDSKSYLFMSNHQSNFDIPVLLAYLKVQFRWLAKAELFKIPLFGYAMHRVGYISIDRSDRKSAFKSLRKAAEIVRNGVSVMIFPEGTRSFDGKILPFKKGGFILAVESGVPIVPIIIRGTQPIMPKKGLRINPGNVTLEILNPITTSKYSRKQKNELMEKVRDVICQALDEDR